MVEKEGVVRGLYFGKVNNSPSRTKALMLVVVQI
jgi:hypothetical protein